MQNFGRGMWRRVGDYERIQVPRINKNYELEKYLVLMEYIKQQREKLNTYCQQILQVNKDNITNNTSDDKEILVKEELKPNIDEPESINEEDVVIQDVVIQDVVIQDVVIQDVVIQDVVIQDVVNEDVIQDVVNEDVIQDVVNLIELPSIIPKKGKKKQKKNKK